jgi:hypothetical protein
MQSTRIYKCNFYGCNAQFSDAASLLEHIHRDHTEWDKPYYCWICSAAFADLAGLTRHCNGRRHERRVELREADLALVQSTAQAAVCEALFC